MTTIRCLLRLVGINKRIDALFDALLDTPIELIVCRHEQNAAFMAASFGRLTGKPGVVLVTSGPGVSNLCTGLLTANTEGDPVVAIGGNVPRALKYKASHQQADNVALLCAATQQSVEVPVVDAIPEMISNAFRRAQTPRKGAVFISVPQDILQEKTRAQAQSMVRLYEQNQASDAVLAELVQAIVSSKQPVLLLGEEASEPAVAAAIDQLLRHHALAVVSTFQAAGVVARDTVGCFVGRVGLFKNQPGDQLLQSADCIITVGFNPVEYDPETWFGQSSAQLIHVDYRPCQIRSCYSPTLECIGDLAKTISALKERLPAQVSPNNADHIHRLSSRILTEYHSGKERSGLPIHPLRFIYELREAIDDDALVISDIGSHYMWLARYFWSFKPRHLLFSNGQQTLGVALPWAIGAHFANPKQRIISISGDGGFLFSAMELETAGRVGANFIHFVWCDGHYDMVREQQRMKYAREAAVAFGPVDLVGFANAFGATGIRLQDPADIKSIVSDTSLVGPVLVEVPIDYRDNLALFQDLHNGVGN